MIRLLVIGDLHLRSGAHLDDVCSCLQFAARLADERKVDGVLIAGDAFEGQSTPEERDALGEALFELSMDLSGTRRGVVAIRGNHDKPGDLAVYSRYPSVTVRERPEIVSLTHPSSVTTLDVLCVPWTERAYLAATGYTGEGGDVAGSSALAAMLRAMVASREHPERPLVVLAHLQVLGAISSSAQPLVGRSIEVALGDLQDLGAAAVVLGHVHKPQELAPNVHYVGSLTCHDFGEEDEAKRIGLLTIDDAGAASWEWVPVPCRRWVTVEATVFEQPTGKNRRRVPRRCEWISPPSLPNGATWMQDANVRYRYTCDEVDEHLFDHAEIERRFSGAHTLKIVPQVSRFARVRSADVAAARTVEEKLRAWGQATGTEIPDSVLTKLGELEGEVARG